MVLQVETGHWQERPEGVEATLRRSRSHIWGAVPECPATGRALLDRYVRDRRARLPARPKPTWLRLRREPT